MAAGGVVAAGGVALPEVAGSAGIGRGVAACARRSCSDGGWTAATAPGTARPATAMSVTKIRAVICASLLAQTLGHGL